MVALLESAMTMTSQEDFPQRLDKAIKLTGLSRTAFAEKNGFSEGTLRGYLRGDTEPRRNDLISLARGLRVNLRWLVDGDGPMELPSVGNEIRSTASEQPIIQTSLAQTYFDRGATYFSLGQNHEAITEFVQSEACAAKSGERTLQIRALTEAARCLVRVGDLDQTLALLNRARELIDPNSPIELLPENLLGIASLQFRKGKFLEMEQQLFRARQSLEDPSLANSPLQRRYWELVAGRAQAYERWEEALDAHEKMPSFGGVTEDLASLGNWINKAIVLIHLGRINEAEALAQKVNESIGASTNPSYANLKALSYTIKGLVQERLGNWSDALIFYLRSDEINESSEPVVGAARCMRILNSPIYKVTLKRALELMSQEVATPYLDCTPEFLFLLEVAPLEAESIARAWITSMTRLVPDDYWQTPNRRKLLDAI